MNRLSFPPARRGRDNIGCAMVIAIFLLGAVLFVAVSISR
jgi:hypothetical protein